MPLPVDQQGTANGTAGVAAPGTSGGEVTAAQGNGAAGANGVALAVRESGPDEAETEEEAIDKRLRRLPMQADVLVKVHSFRVQDLLSMEKGTVVETVHEHTQDVPVRCGGALLLWSEFEVLDQRLAVRVTRLA